MQVLATLRAVARSVGRGTAVVCVPLLATAVGVVTLGVAAGPVVPSRLPGNDRSACTVSATLVNSCRPWLGAAAGNYPNLATGWRAQIDGHESRIGRRLDIVHNYHAPAATTLSADEKYFATRAGTMLFVNWKPATSSWTEAIGAANGGSATVDANIDTLADSIKSVAPNQVFLTLHHEPEAALSGGANGCDSTFTYNTSNVYGTPADYRAMWRNVRSRFDARGASNVVWTMDYMNFSRWDCVVDDVYPGNDLVDWVMFNAYGGKANPSFSTNVQRFYNLLSTTSDATHDYLSKPWGIAEWGFNADTSDLATAEAYYDQAKTAIDNNTFPRVKALVAWDNKDAHENRIAYCCSNSSSTYFQEKQDHYNALANDQAMGGGSTAPPADTTAPSAPTNLSAANASGGGVDLSWTAATDNVGVTGYDVYRDGAKISSVTGTTYHDGTVSPATTYSYTVKAVDAAGNVSAASNAASVTTPAAPDTTAPTAPSNLSAANATAGGVDLTWSAATDNVAVTGYHVNRNGAVVATLGAVTSYHDSSVADATTYNYTVDAFDAAGNTSAASNTATVTTPTPADTTAPSAPTGLQATASSPTNVNLTWTASTDNVGVTGYNIYRGGSKIDSVGAVTSYSDRTVSESTAYSYQVEAFDAAGNTSAKSNTATVTTPASPDTSPPTTPANLAASNVSYSSLTISWDASTDNRGVAGYRLYRDGTLIASPGGTTYNDSGLTQGKSYSYTVKAYDTSGNESPASSPLTVSTLADNVAPSVPGSLSATTTQSYLVSLKWTASTDSGGSGLAGYRVYRTVSGTTSLLFTLSPTATSYSDTLVKAGTSYTYQVSAFDGAGNESAKSNTASATTAPAAETKAPTAPTKLKVSSVTQTTVSLSWAASKDNTGVKGYHVYRDGKYVGDSTTTSYTDSGLASGTTHTYYVVAFDASANVSGQSSTVTATTK